MALHPKDIENLEKGLREDGDPWCKPGTCEDCDWSRPMKDQ